MRNWFLVVVTVVLFWSGQHLMAAAPEKLTAIDLSHVQSTEIGAHIEFLIEDNVPMTLSAVVRAFESGGQASTNSVLNFGIGSSPVWLHFDVLNPGQHLDVWRLIIETSWLDQIEVFFRHGGQTRDQFLTGDLKAFADRPVDHRFFAFDHEFSPGRSSVYLRVKSPDSMVLPILLLDLEQARAREVGDGLLYGLIYGFVLALLAYNATLFVGLKNSHYLYYVLYLSLFLVMNLAYSGNGYQWFWPNSPALQAPAITVLMGLYSAAGLMFASKFLGINVRFPRVNKALVLVSVGALALLAIATIFSLPVFAQFVAFPYMLLFSITMIALGVLALKAGVNSARYFLVATIAAMIGATLTPLAVWGAIPYNAWTYHALEAGMLIEAVLLALALANQFRINQEGRIEAERLSLVDPLTKLNNRRAFHNAVVPVLDAIGRNRRSYSMILIDIDRFKLVNDTYGHPFGNEILVMIANALAGQRRKGDVLARWGGEEFIYFLPDTDLDEAALVAERQRSLIERAEISFEGQIIPVTASFGVAWMDENINTLDDLVNAADIRLYKAK